MKNKYRVKVSFNIEVEEKDEAQAFSAALFERVYGNATVKNLSMHVLSCTPLIEVPKKAETGQMSEGAKNEE
jgi:hypothetical protein